MHLPLIFTCFFLRGILEPIAEKEKYNFIHSYTGYQLAALPDQNFFFAHSIHSTNILLRVQSQTQYAVDVGLP